MISERTIMHKPQLSGATAARPSLPLYDLLSPRPNTCRVSNSPYGSAPGPQECAGPCSGLRAFDTGHLPLQHLCKSRPAGYEPHIAVSHSPVPVVSAKRAHRSSRQFHRSSY
jgi:hypothetical protein